MSGSSPGPLTQRVVVTGLGVVSPLGCTPDDLWEALSAGKSGVTAPDSPSTKGLPVDVVAEAAAFSGDIENFGELEKDLKKSIRKGLKMMNRECQMGVAVVQKALAHGRMTAAACDPTRIGVDFGTDYMLSMPEEFADGIAQVVASQGRFVFSQWPVEGMPRMTPLWLLKYLPNMPASHAAIYNDLRGPNNSITLREAAANLAVAEAAAIIASGRADAMVAGATGTRLHPLKTIHAVQQEELATCDGDPGRASRPFDRDRTGAVLGEGAGAILLESLASAEARGATIYAEVLAGASSVAVGPHLVARRERALHNCLRLALARAGLAPEEVGHVHAHGLGTRSGDAEEAAAIRGVFGDRPVPVVAAKSQFGNLGAGGGMVELVASILALARGRLFPVLNYENADPDCPVAAVRDAQTPPGESFVKLSVTPQGQASAVVMRKAR